MPGIETARVGDRTDTMFSARSSAAAPPARSVSVAPSRDDGWPALAVVVVGLVTVVDEPSRLSLRKRVARTRAVAGSTVTYHDTSAATTAMAAASTYRPPPSIAKSSSTPMGRN